MNFLEFANPIGWWAALLAVPVIALYILKTRMRRQQVSTLLFWDQLFDEKRPRAWWQQLRRLVSLLLQLAFLLLLVAALVDPLWSWQRQRQRRVVLVIDNSASMQATTEKEGTRLDSAKDTARAFVRSLRGNDQMALLTGGGTPVVAMGMTDHQNSLLDAIDRVDPTDGPTVVPDAVELARRLLTDFEGESEIVVLTDGAFDPPPEAGEPKAMFYGVGGDTPNVGITRYQVRRSLMDAVGYQVLVDVTNFSDEPASHRITFTLEDDLVDVVPVDLEPNETVTRVIDHTSTEGGRLRATLDADDALLADNRALALLPRRDPVPVVLVTQGNLFLESVLRSIPLVALEVTGEPPAAALADGILVLDQQVPEQLPTGRVLVVDPAGDCNLWKLGEAIEEPIVASVDQDSPLTQHVRLTNVLFPEAREIEFAGEAVALVKDPLDHPLLARLPRSGGDAVVLTCSLEKGDLPLRIAFPVLMKNAIEWFQGTEGELQPAVPTGAMATVQLAALNGSAQPTPPSTRTQEDEPTPPASDTADVVVVQSDPKSVARSLVLTSPSGQNFPLVASGDEAVVGPLGETGLWSISRDTDREASDLTADNAAADSDEPESLPPVAIACNLASPSESDLRPRFPLTSVDQLNLLSLGGHSIWYYLTLAAVGLVTAEWWLYQRRIVE